MHVCLAQPLVLASSKLCIRWPQDLAVTGCTVLCLCAAGLLNLCVRTVHAAPVVHVEGLDWVDLYAPCVVVCAYP
jgi:hypothetical protein